MGPSRGTEGAAGVTGHSRGCPALRYGWRLERWCLEIDRGRLPPFYRESCLLRGRGIYLFDENADMSQIQLGGPPPQSSSPFRGLQFARRWGYCFRFRYCCRAHTSCQTFCSIKKLPHRTKAFDWPCSTVHSTNSLFK